MPVLEMDWMVRAAEVIVRSLNAVMGNARPVKNAIPIMMKVAT